MDALLRADQVARILNVRPSTLYALCYRGVLPYIRLTQGRRRPLLRFRRDDVEKLLRERTVPAKNVASGK